MVIGACRFASTAGLAALLIVAPEPITVPDPTAIALWGIVITSAAGIILQVLRSTADARRDERRHRFDMENRRLAAEERHEIIKALELNAALVKNGTAKAEAAFQKAAATLASATLTITKDDV